MKNNGPGRLSLKIVVEENAQMRSGKVIEEATVRISVNNEANQQSHCLNISQSFEGSCIDYTTMQLFHNPFHER